MKKVLLVVFVLVTSTNLNAQSEVDFKNSIRIGGLGLFTGFYEFQYERVVSENGSIRFGFGTGTLRDASGNAADDDFMDAFGSNSFNNDNRRVVEGFTANAEYRYFFTHLKAPKGLYASPGIQYLSLTDTYTYKNSNDVTETLIENDYSVFNLRALFGYQFIIAKRFILNPYIGAGIALGNVDQNNGQDNAFGTGFSLNAGIDLGIGF